ncbi:uncharacterized protein MYCGRDRAFT_97906 [Zymoseptoria tritici IPO323]|uniref:Uncharacterized protein n=1 Tax=Zymoseptoria tritici (strain CBS 115943 / IPO323) TaxID=336722 RepID=F9XRR1_ZYMTI|nr:uncharacterized protein MYCGRDRAFT_97906 [Zymoseptoria tritici IPO323]EGP82082.1 hypothetical protein MYCGRDRAFT_97906 [Zymoseptoria tritici IPO323]
MFPSGFIADPDTPVVLQHDRFRGGFAGFEANHPRLVREDDAFWGSFLLPRRSFDQDECISVGTPCPSTQEYLVTFTLGDDAPSRGAVATSSVQHASTSKETSRRTSLDSPQELSNEFDESIGGGTASRKRKRDPNMGAASSARAVCTR